MKLDISNTALYNAEQFSSITDYSLLTDVQLKGHFSKTVSIHAVTKEAFMTGFRDKLGVTIYE